MVILVLVTIKKEVFLNQFHIDLIKIGLHGFEYTTAVFPLLNLELNADIGKHDI